VLHARSLLKLPSTERQTEGFELLSELRHSFPHEPDIKLRFAEACYERGNYSEVLQLLDSIEAQLDELSIEYADAVMLRANTLLQLQKHDDAARILRRADALKLQPILS
jgi:tetratricopeptide (TPR) repeat protein